MAYSGKFKVKNYSKYKGDFDNIVYRSLWEKSVFQWCDSNPKVKAWSSEETIMMAIKNIINIFLMLK